MRNSRMDISNKSAFFIGAFANLGGYALGKLGIEVEALPLLIFSVIGIGLVFIKNSLDSKAKKVEEHSGEIPKKLKQNLKEIKDLELKFPLADWLTGKDVVNKYNISHDQLMQHINKGLSVYPENTVGESPPPNRTPSMDEEAIGFFLGQDDEEWRQEIEKVWFKGKDIEQYIKLQRTDNNSDLFPELNETALKKHIALASSHCPFEKVIKQIYLFEGTPFRYQIVVIGKDTKDFDGMKRYWEFDLKQLFEKHFSEIYRKEPSQNFWNDWDIIVAESLDEIADNLILKNHKWIIY